MATKQKVAISCIQLLADFIEQHGGQPRMIFKSAGVDIVDLQNPNAMISLDRHLKLFRETLRFVPDEVLGLHLGERSQAGSFGILGYLCLNSPTVLNAFENYCRYESLINNDPLRNECKADKKRFRFIYCFSPFDPLYDKIRAEFSMASVTNLVKYVLGKQAPLPQQVTFKHPKPEGSFAEYQRIFNCPVLFNQDSTSIVYPASLLKLKINQSNSDLFNFLEGKAVELISKGDRENSFSEKVFFFLSQNFFEETIRMKRVAKSFGMAPHTLRRRLKLEKKSFREILTSVQKEKAEFLLKNPELSLKQICFMMKFEEPTSFYKAFKKWTGMTPQKFRKKAGRISKACQ